MKIKSIRSVGKKKVYDISVQDAEHYILENGVVTHNTGVMYSADTVIIFGRQQDKEGTELLGYNFILNIEKSRFVKEKSKIPLSVSFESGINVYSGILDLAVESGLVAQGKYSRSLGYALVDESTGEVGEMVPYKKTQTEEFLGKIIKSKKFAEFVQGKYKLSSMNTETSDEDLDDFVSSTSDDLDVIDQLDTYNETL